MDIAERRAKICNLHVDTFVRYTRIRAQDFMNLIFAYVCMNDGSFVN